MTKHNRAVRRPAMPTLNAYVWKVTGGLWAFHLDGSGTRDCVISFDSFTGKATSRAGAEDMVRNLSHSVGCRIALFEAPPPDASPEGGAR